MGVAASIITENTKDIVRRFSDFGDTTPNYEELFDGYARLGLQPGSAVLIFAPNRVEFLLHWIAVLANGYVPCAIAPSTKAARVSMLIKSLKFAAVAGPQRDPVRVHSKRLTNIGAFTVGILERISPPYEPYDVLMLTTGTSGAQTACVHRVDSLIWNASMTNATLDITAADRQLVSLPLYHSYGLVTQSIGAIIAGCELKLDGPPFNTARFSDIIRNYKISVCCITPTIARDILNKETDIPYVRSMSIGGDKMSSNDITTLLGKSFIHELYITYGLTEAGPRVSVLPAHLASIERLDSVGLPFDGVETRIEKPDGQGVGQLLVRTLSVCRRKVGGNILRQPITSDGFLETGDLFTKDAAGYLRYIARKSETLIVKGEKVNTRNIDMIAVTHPDVHYARTTVNITNTLEMQLWAKDDKVLDISAIRTYLKSALRLHEVPDHITQQVGDVFHK